MRSRHLHPLLLLLPILTFALTNKEKTLIVDKHNYYRTQTDPPATDMRTLTWDSSLEDLATSYAAKCVWEHNEERGFRGENLFLMSGSRLDVAMGLADWFNEKDFYNFTANSCQEGQMCGHYTQMVWAGTERVGCGEKFCEKIEGFDDGNMYLLVCNYEPPGNFQGEKPYKPGDPCAACPPTHTCKGSLCAGAEQNGTDGLGTEGAPYTTERVTGPPADTTEGFTVITIPWPAPSNPPEMAPGTPDGMVPSTAPEMAPGTPDGLAPSTAPEMAPGTPDGLAPSTAPEMAPGTPDGLAPSTPPEMAPGTPDGLAPSTAPEMAPGTPDGLAPSTAPEMAPGTPDGLAPSTAPEMAPGTPDGLAPDTVSVLIEEKQSEATLLEADVSTSKMVSDTAVPPLTTSAPTSVPPAVPTTEPILDLTPPSSERATDMPHTSVPGDRSETHSAPPIPENPSIAPPIPENPSIAPPMPENPSIAPPMPENPSIAPPITERPSIAPPVPESPQPIISLVSPAKQKVEEDISMLEVKDQPVGPTLKSPKSPPKEKKNGQNPKSDPKEAQKIIKGKEKQKYSKKDRLHPKYKGVTWSLKSSVYSGGSYFGKPVFGSPFAFRPVWKVPLYRINDASPHKEPNKPCKRSGHTRGIYSLYLPPKQR